jgi:GrpB-like predicted nucleotidyltransferase (UPF0157 family)
VRDPPRVTAPEEWPDWATEPVEIVDPDPRWLRAGAAEARLLDARLADWVSAPAEHVGSTAVPGLPAKPIIDLQVAVRELHCAGPVAEVLRPLGWCLVPAELDQRPWRRFLVRVHDGRRAAHLHLVRGCSRRWHDQLAFRDVLRADPALTAEYASLKRRLARCHATDREAYTAAKGAFVNRVVLAARRRGGRP